MPKKCPKCGIENDDNEKSCRCCGENFTFWGDLELDTANLTSTLIENRYEILSTLRTSSTGSIYKARDAGKDNIIALKKILTSLTRDELKFAEQKFHEKAKLISKLNHQGIPKIIDSFSSKDYETLRTAYYVAMTLIEGKNLEKIMSERERNPLPLEQSLNYFKQILDILAFFHSQDPPIVFGELRPSNIIIGKEKIYLVDFGFSSYFSPNIINNSTGSFNYFAPEQLLKYPEDPRSDLYSLGAIMHYLLTGINPTENSQPPFIFAPPGRLNPNIPEYLDRLIISMLDITPDFRPGSAAEIIDTIESEMKAISTVSDGASAIKEGETIFDAIDKNDVESIKMLIDQGIDINIADNFGDTPLHKALFEGHGDIAELLISVGANVNSLDGAYSTPLHKAATKGLMNIVELLIAKGADINATDDSNSTPLHWAASRGNKAVVNLLIAKGADVNAKDDNDNTPLHNASMQGTLDVTELLISSGAEVNAKDIKGKTPLHWAAYKIEWAINNEHLKIIELLIGKGADVNAKDINGHTPLRESVENGHREIAELLITKGADVNAKDEHGNSLLREAAFFGHKELAELLILKGANPNQTNKKGETPLHWAAYKGYRDVIDALLTKGANVNAKDNSGDTPLNLAEQAKNTSIAEFLISKGAKYNIKKRALKKILDLRQ